MSYEKELEITVDHQNDLPENIDDILPTDKEIPSNTDEHMPECKRGDEDARDPDGIAEPGGDVEESEKEEAQRTIDSLRSEIEHLKSQIAHLEELKRSHNRILAEIGDFAALFPEIPIESIPDTVWESVKNGTPLAASYALYEKRMASEALRIARINAKNASKSPGSAGTDTAGEYFSPEDVKKMSRAEVHANYSKIKESMKKWMQK